MKTTPRHWQVLLAICATIAAGWVLLRWIDLTATLAFLRPENLPGIATASIFFALVNVVRGVRIARLTTRYVRIPVDVRSGIGLATVTNLANHVLPLRLGELVYVSLSRSVFHVPLAQGAGVLLAMRIYDLVGLIMLALLGLTQAPGLASTFSVPAFSALALLLLAVAVRLDLVFATAARVLPGKLAAKLRDALPFTREPRFVATSLLYALAIWSVQATAFAVLLRAFGIDVGTGPMVVATSIANLAAVLPLSALGTFGAQEAGWTAGFVAMGVSATAAANSGLAAHLVMVALNVLMSLAFVPRLLSRSGAAESREPAAPLPKHPRP